MGERLERGVAWWNRSSRLLGRRSDVVLALGVAAIVAMMILPLPTAALDLLITLNLSIAVTLLMVAIYISDALRIATFPTILLLTTLYRLGLNVSSTRLILLQGDAGRVIEAFGSFVVAGNYVVGAVIFFILLVIQFVVIAKGSERVAEVAARFTLDALPGKQLALDADLRSGVIDRLEARRLRRALQRESQFYGAMDGAMKFVKGDAIAGIVITIVNIVAGLAIGVLQRDMSVDEALRHYGLLTIGDGLVSQIPALVISTAAGLVVTRVASESPGRHLGEEIGGQVLAHPRALLVVGGLLVGLGLVPGLPFPPFFLLGVVSGLAGWGLLRAERRERLGGPSREEESISAADMPERLILRVGPDLLGAGREAAALQEALVGVKHSLGKELGVELPPFSLRPLPDDEDPERVVLEIDELPALRFRRQGDEPIEKIAERVERTIARRADLFIGIQETRAKLDALARSYPDLVRELPPDKFEVATLAEVLRRLVQEGVSVRDMRTIIEAVLGVPESERTPTALTERVRVALTRQLTARAMGNHDRIEAWQLTPDLEEALRDALVQRDGGPTLALEPELCDDLIGAVRHAAAERRDNRLIVLASPDLRRPFWELLNPELPDMTVLTPSELEPGVEVVRLGWIDPLGLAMDTARGGELSAG